MSHNDHNKPKRDDSQDAERHKGDAEHGKEWKDPKKSDNNPK